jgi:hypothetical protein
VHASYFQVTRDTIRNSANLVACCRLKDAAGNKVQIFYDIVVNARPVTRIAEGRRIDGTSPECDSEAVCADEVREPMLETGHCAKRLAGFSGRR